MEHGNVEPEVCDDIGHRPGLFADRFAKRHVQVFSDNGQHHAGPPSAGPHIEDFFLRAQKLGKCQTIGQIAGDEFFEVGMPRKVDLCFPLPQ